MTNINDKIEQFFSETENLAGTGNLTNAEQQLRQFLDKQDLIKARAHNDSGVISYRQEKNEKALKHYQKAVELAPQESLYRKNLADLYYFAYGEIEIALAHYRQILADNPRDFDASFAIGKICSDLSRHFLTEAKDFFDLAGKVKPNDEFLREELRKINSNTFAEKTAVADHKPRDTNATIGNADEIYTDFSKTFQAGQELETEKALQEFIEQHPDYALAYNDLGVTSHQLEKIDQAGRCYRKAVSLAPENITFRKNLADFIFVIENKPEEAMPHYHEVLKSNPKDLEVLMMIGNICLALDSPEEARNFFNLVLDIEPWNLDASRALEVLDKND